jgi:hypothetical protein
MASPSAKPKRLCDVEKKEGPQRRALLRENFGLTGKLVGALVTRTEPHAFDSWFATAGGAEMAHAA